MPIPNHAHHCVLMRRNRSLVFWWVHMHSTRFVCMCRGVSRSVVSESMNQQFIVVPDSKWPGKSHWSAALALLAQAAKGSPMATYEAS